MTLPVNQILCGDCLEIMREWPDGSVHCCVTSPPYWGKRDYGVNGQIGLERTLDEYVARLVAVCREIRRVLRDDGTFWLNLGDSYANDGKWGGETGGKQAYLDDNNRRRVGREKRRSGLKPKDLCMVPARVALALQADGWWIRKDIIWAKPNPMPESVTDRPTSSHEHVFLLTKAARYYYDAERVKEAAGPVKRCGPNSRADNDRDPAHGTRKQDALGKNTYTGFNDRWKNRPSEGRNLRDVWTLVPRPFKGPHYAVFPPKLPTTCMKAGTSERGACPECGTPWERVMDILRAPRGDAFGRKDASAPDHGQAGSGYLERLSSRTLGWRPGCACYGLDIIDDPISPPVQRKEEKDADFAVRVAAWKALDADWQTEWTRLAPLYMAQSAAPCLVLDPFCGSGTTCVAAKSEGMNYVGIDISGEYCAIARRRVAETEESLFKESNPKAAEAATPQAARRSPIPPPGGRPGLPLQRKEPDHA